jgi:hypothetical protein
MVPRGMPAYAVRRQGAPRRTGPELGHPKQMHWSGSQATSSAAFKRRTRGQNAGRRIFGRRNCAQGSWFKRTSTGQLGSHSPCREFRTCLAPPDAGPHQEELASPGAQRGAVACAPTAAAAARKIGEQRVHAPTREARRARWTHPEVRRRSGDLGHEGVGYTDAGAVKLQRGGRAGAGGEGTAHGCGGRHGCGA